jgi:lipoprotein-anchoring transpeptidase ErfK/SrfK
VALAVSAYSETLDVFDNGVPVIALHGTSRPDLLGQAVSNGCIRVPNDVIQQLADTVPQGTPVYLRP